VEAGDLIKHIDCIVASTLDGQNVLTHGPYATMCEFLRQFAGERSSFYMQACGLNKTVPVGRVDLKNRHTVSILQAFAEYLKAGLAQEVPPERQAQLDVVSDLLDQANTLICDSKVHPAAPAMLIGATLEEFLRTWAEKEGLVLGSKKPSIDSYMKVLREAGLLDKQDTKDITAWGGIRNDAAHGAWEKVEDRQKISLMLQGVSLFQRTCGTK